MLHHVDRYQCFGGRIVFLFFKTLGMVYQITWYHTSKEIILKNEWHIYSKWILMNFKHFNFAIASPVKSVNKGRIAFGSLPNDIYIWIHHFIDTGNGYFCISTDNLFQVIIMVTEEKNKLSLRLKKNYSLMPGLRINYCSFFEHIFRNPLAFSFWTYFQKSIFLQILE